MKKKTAKSVGKKEKTEEIETANNDGKAYWPRLCLTAVWLLLIVKLTDLGAVSVVSKA